MDDTPSHPPQHPSTSTPPAAGHAGWEPGAAWQGARWTAEEIGEKLFELRDYTPIPLIILTLFVCDPTVRTATLGTLLVILGELVRIYSVAFIGSVSRTRNTATTGGQLINTGPFAYVRNPLYVGNFFIAMGFAVFAGVAWLMALTAVLFFCQYYCIVKHEEKLLISRFGAEYEEYMRNVPAWVPARLPDLDSLEWPSNFSPALRSERRTLATIAFLLLALAFLSSAGKNTGA